MNGIPLTMHKGDYSRTFWLFNDGTYRILNPTGWSPVYEDFADAYIRMREAGFKEEGR